MFCWYNKSINNKNVSDNSDMQQSYAFGFPLYFTNLNKKCVKLGSNKNKI